MFEYLDNATIQNAFPAGHHAIQYVRKQWTSVSSRNGIDNTTEDLTPMQAKLVKRIIKDIEIAEGKPVAELSPRIIDRYIKVIAERIEQLSRKKLNVNQTVGRNLLDELRASMK